jgi:regulator of RNase E activity RraB
MTEYPQDADGDALRRIQADGSDMSRPMDIDFAVAVPDEAAGNSVAEGAKALGYKTDVVHDLGEDDGESWTCYCTRRMIPTHQGLLNAQEQLDELGRRFGGYADGWGSFGNIENQR